MSASPVSRDMRRCASARSQSLSQRVFLGRSGRRKAQTIATVIVTDPSMTAPSAEAVDPTH